MDTPGPRSPDPERPRPSTPTAFQVRLMAGAALAILFGVFVARNAREVEVHFVFFSANVRLIWVFVLCGLIGAVVDRLLQRRGILGRADVQEDEADGDR